MHQNRRGDSDFLINIKPTTGIQEKTIYQASSLDRPRTRGPSQYLDCL